MSTGKKPDWSICVKPKGNEGKWTKIGAAWTSEKGNISMRLDDGTDPPNWETETVMLFPYREDRRWKRGTGGNAQKWAAPMAHTAQKPTERQKPSQPVPQEDIGPDPDETDPNAPHWL